MTEDRFAVGQRVSLITIVINTVLAVIKLLAGVFGLSNAMLADSLHSFSDSISSIAVMVGLRISGLPPDPEHHYGHGRAEAVATKIVALILILTAGGVGLSAIRTLMGGEYSQPGFFPLVAAALSIVIKEGLFHYAYRVGKRINSNALIADAWHHRTDSLSSITALLGIGGARLGFPLLDPLAGLVVALMVLFTGVRLYWQSIEELVDRAPNRELLDQIIGVAKATPGVIDVNEIKARLHGPKVYTDLKICVNRFITVQDGHSIAHLAADRIKQELSEVDQVLIHVNPCHSVSDEKDQFPDCLHCNQRYQHNSSAKDGS